MQDRGARGARRGVRPAGARADRPRRDERRGRALQGVPQARHQADRRLRGLLRRRPHGRRPEPRRAQPPDAAGRRSTTGYRNLVKLSSAGFLEGLQRGKPTVDMALSSPRRGRHRADGLPGVALLPAAGRGPGPGGAGSPRRPAARVRAGARLLRGPEERHRRAGACNEGIVRIAREVGRPLVGTGDVHYLRREDYDHHTALLCVQTKSTLAAPKMTFETNEFFLRDSEEMAEAFARMARGDREHARDRRALRRRDRARQAADPELPDARRRDERATTCARWSSRACALRYGDPAPAAARERAEMELGVIEQDGLQRLLPDRLGLRSTTPRTTASPSARAAARPPARSSPTAWRSPTSTRCATTCSSSASSTPSACRCRTSTSTSRSAAASA